MGKYTPGGYVSTPEWRPAATRAGTVRWARRRSRPGRLGWPGGGAASACREDRRRVAGAGPQHCLRPYVTSRPRRARPSWVRRAERHTTVGGAGGVVAPRPHGAPHGHRAGGRRGTGNAEACSRGSPRGGTVRRASCGVPLGTSHYLGYVAQRVSEVTPRACLRVVVVTAGPMATGLGAKLVPSGNSARQPRLPGARLRRRTVTHLSTPQLVERRVHR